ncbi:MAG: DUF302 domain-containing protein [Candidatus Polarisedimenticolaceae bacterium]|nr:DUF302 domain-containing protein [Candidatus Polarisedimenticolaceae bacterium]
MRPLQFALLSLLLISSATFADNGLVTIKSAHDVPTTTNRLVQLLKERGMTLFNRINHADGAADVGMQLRPTELLIFGNPKAGTPLMICAQQIAIDLPQKTLIWQDEAGATWLTYNNPLQLAKRHDLAGCDKVLKKISQALVGLATTATAP